MFVLILLVFDISCIKLTTASENTGLILFCNDYFYLNNYSLDHLAPKLSSMVNQTTQNVNSIFQVTCPIQEGSQPLFFEWLRNGQTLKSGPDVSYKIESSDIISILTIKRIQRSDHANYTCLVRNAFGTDSRTVRLTVKGN